MERRTFLQTILGVAAATALPSEVWPFRKIFLPLAPTIIRPTFNDLSNAHLEAAVEAIELESFKIQIPILYKNANFTFLAYLRS